MKKHYSAPVVQLDLMDEACAAKVIVKSVAWMQQARWRGVGPRYLKIGRNCRYRMADLEAYLASCAVGTADQPAAEESNTNK